MHAGAVRHIWPIKSPAFYNDPAVSPIFRRLLREARPYVVGICNSLLTAISRI